MYRTTVGFLVRRNLRAILAIGLLCGVVAGVGLWGLAASRRTASTYERYLSAADVTDVSVNVVFFEEAVPVREALALRDEAARIDGVIADASYVGLESMLLEQDLEDPDNAGEILGSLDGRFLDQDTVAVEEGRLPVPDREGEILINPTAAAIRHLEVGDTGTMLVADAAALEAITSEEEASALEPVGTFEFEVVGIAIFPADILADEYDRSPRVLVTPAATERWVDVAGTYVWHGLRLEDPSQVDRVLADYAELAGDGTFLNTLVTADQASDVQRSVQPVVAALVVFGMAALLAALGVTAIAISRLTRGQTELSVFRAMGARPRELVLIGGAPAVVAVLLAGGVAAAVAVSLSPLSPLGAIRSVEPDRGIDADFAVLAAGVALIVLVLSGVTLFVAIRSGRGAVVARATGRPSWSSRLGSSLRPAAALGVRRGIGSSPVGGAPTRGALVGTAIAMLAVVASLTFGASLRSLADTPSRYGWSTDLALTAGAGYDAIDLTRAERIADADERVEGLMVAGFADAQIEGTLVPAMAAETVRGEPQLTLLDGRLPERDDEISLGRRTADDIGADVGDEVAGADGPLHVVGIVAFPAIGPLTAAHPGMGEGALFTFAALAGVDAQPSVAFVDLADGIVSAEVAHEISGEFTAATDGGFMEPFPLLRPAELDGAEDANGTVGAIALIVGGAAILGLAAVVMASVWGRRRELAVLRVLGFTSGDLRRSVRWQALSLVGLAIAAGLPLGIAAGRLTWQTFAETLGVAPTPTVPVALILGSAALAALLAIAATVPAAGQAARMSVAPALRPE